MQQIESVRIVCRQSILLRITAPVERPEVPLGDNGVIVHNQPIQVVFEEVFAAVDDLVDVEFANAVAPHWLHVRRATEAAIGGMGRKRLHHRVDVSRGFSFGMLEQLLEHLEVTFVGGLRDALLDQTKCHRLVNDVRHWITLPSFAGWMSEARDGGSCRSTSSAYPQQK